MKSAGAKQRVADQADDLGRVDPMTGLAPQVLADRLRHWIRNQHLGEGGRRGGPPSLPQLIDLAFLDRWGRIGAATLRSLTVNHGAHRTTKPTARQL